MGLFNKSASKYIVSYEKDEKAKRNEEKKKIEFQNKDLVSIQNSGMGSENEECNDGYCDAEFKNFVESIDFKFSLLNFEIKYIEK